jgi:predicted  nucleic acid-binding Zn-ribbon protein
LKKEIEDLNDVINKYTNEISFLKGHLDSSKSNFNSGLEAMLEEKDNLLMKARKETSNKEFKIRELEDEISRLEETIRKMRKDLNEIEYFKQ